MTRCACGNANCVLLAGHLLCPAGVLNIVLKDKGRV